jgi:hypothetical protein
MEGTLGSNALQLHDVRPPYLVIIGIQPEFQYCQKSMSQLVIELGQGPSKSRSHRCNTLVSPNPSENFYLRGIRTQLTESGDRPGRRWTRCGGEIGQDT